MLNSKDEFVQNVIGQFKTAGVAIELDEKKLVVRDNLLTGEVIFHLIVSLLAIRYTLTLDSSVYFFPLLCLYATIAYVILWADFKAVNIMEFDLLNKNLLIKNRSIIRRFVYTYITPRPIKYYFKDFGTIDVSEMDKTHFPFFKYFVNIKLRNGGKLNLIGFATHVNAVVFSRFVALFID